ncbi:MAG: 4a-hydroxytetrahydrobiopterin dehydratase [Dehalococcoidia bacterium]
MTQEWQASPEPLSEARVEEELRGLPNWHHDGDAIVREYRFGDAAEADRFLSRVEEVGRNVEHDPTIARDGGAVRLTLTTHDTGGVSDKDVKLARLIQAMTDEQATF